MIDPASSAPHPKEKRTRKRLRSSEARIIRIGQDNIFFRDLYVNLLSMPWTGLILLVAVFYLLLSLAFAIPYALSIGGIENATTFADAFFFSVQTMATIGYGRMAPTNLFVNIVTTAEAISGFIYFAFVTGLIFAKFSRPTAHVLFSDIAVISDYEGMPHLKIRLANKRNNRIVDATARMFLLRYSMTKEGVPMRQFIDLKVARSHMPSLRLTWTLMHPIDEDSPFFGATERQLMQPDDEIFVTIIGLDETLAQTIHARHTYVPDEVIHGAFFEDVVKRNDDTVELNYEKFHTVKHQLHAVTAREQETKEVEREVTGVGNERLRRAHHSPP